ncbi:MAG: lysylphosphatidylglycerol synthase transmembrane domain-containing protein [Mariprofundales bacterium]|nr:lysylphosphatidylglycerol synthase transmembrane domain-containing protein [Mariprofundales bacterium]
MFATIKLLLSVAVLAALLYWVDVGAVARQLAGANPWLVAAALGCLLLAYLLSVLRWAWIARGLGIEVSLRRKVRIYFVGAFSSLFLPSTIGGDVVRGVLLAKGEGRSGIGVEAGASVILDRVNGLYALVAVVTLCLPWFTWPALAWWGWGALVLGMVIVMLGWPWLHRRLPERLDWLARLPLDGAHFRRQWLRAMPLSLLVQLLMVQTHLFLGMAIGLELPWLAYGVMVGLVALMAIVPISLNGFGVREAGYVGFVVFFGGSEAQGGALAALWVLLMTAAALPGLWAVWQLGGLGALKQLARS